MYALEYSEEALEQLALLKRSDQQAFKKQTRLLLELTEHPATGTGRVEALKHSLTGLWSRRISDRHRLVYEIQEERQCVLIISVRGHYEDK